jgi:alpha-tubulin suppressor-like RCC1 family protein
MKIFHVSFRSLCVSALLVGVSHAFAQTSVDLSGTVYDQDSKPRVGVIVSLASDFADTTGADGKWSIQGQFVAVKPIASRSATLRWLGGDLVTQFDAPTLVSADLFDASGRRLANLPARMVLSGAQSIALNLPVAGGARWLRVRSGSTSTVLSARSGVQAPSIALPAGLARPSGIVDQILSYSFQGQIVTEDQLPSLIQSGLLKWIQDYRVSAPITLDSRVKVDSVWAWFKGGSMAQPIRARMACDTINQLISGRVYTVKSQDPAAVYAFRTWINVYGNGNHLTAVSDTIGFTTLFGDIAWTRGFSLGNAFPDGWIVSADSVEAGSPLSLSIRLAYLDTASHRVKDSVIKAEWDLADGLGWRASASLPPVAVAKWNAAGIDTVKLRLMDKDSNVAVITKAIKVVNSGSALRLTSGPIDTTITPSDTVSFQLYVRDTSGVAKVIWSYGDGKFDTTKTGSVHAVKHGYPGPSVVVAGKDSTFALTVTVIDSLGGRTTQKLSNVKVKNEVPTILAQKRDTICQRGTNIRISFSVRASSSFRTDWQINKGVFTGGSTDSTILLPNFTIENYVVVMRVTDKSGNVAFDSTVIHVRDKRVVSMAIGLQHSLLIKGDSSLWGSGSNYFGELGLSQSIGEISHYQKLFSGVLKCVAGGHHSLAMKADGSVWGAGSGEFGQLGNQTSTGSYGFVKVFDSAENIFSGDFHSLILRKDGTLWKSGFNFFLYPNDDGAFVKIADSVVMAASGAYHYLLLKKDGTVWAEGDNSFGQLGDSSKTDRKLKLVANGVVSIAAGGNRSYIQLPDGMLWGAGENGNGQLGDYSTISKDRFVRISMVTGAVSVGVTHTLMVNESSSGVQVTGLGKMQYLDGLMDPRTSFGYGFGVSPIVAVAGNSNSIFLDKNYQIMAIGENNRGQLGVSGVSSLLSLTLVNPE